MGPLQDIFETWAHFLYKGNATLAFFRRRRWLILVMSAALLLPIDENTDLETLILSHSPRFWRSSPDLAGIDRQPAAGSD